MLVAIVGLAVIAFSAQATAPKFVASKLLGYQIADPHPRPGMENCLVFCWVGNGNYGLVAACACPVGASILVLWVGIGMEMHLP